MVDTLRETRSVGQEMAKTQTEMVSMINGLKSIQSNQLEIEQRLTARYEKHEKLVNIFAEKVFQNLQQRLGASESQFRIGFSGIQNSLHELMNYSQYPPSPNTNFSANAGGFGTSLPRLPFSMES